jgi:hypothetical protein
MLLSLVGVLAINKRWTECVTPDELAAAVGKNINSEKK